MPAGCRASPPWNWTRRSDVKRAAGIFALAALCAACDRPVPDVVLHAADAAPAMLSEWGVVYRDGDAFAVNPAAAPYELNTPLFSDYAHKLRTVWLPPGTRAAYREDGPLDFPVGTIISKTFYYPAARDGAVARRDAERTALVRRIGFAENRVLETRLLVHYEDGWKALPYVWNAGQTDAALALAGDVVSLAFDDGSESFHYVVPDANQCAGCHVTNHSARVLEPIGPRAWQLNRVVDVDGTPYNQLAYWQETGLLDGVPDDVPAGIDASDAASASLESRARAYLASNCAHCHNANGPADTSALDLSLTASAGRTIGVCKPPVAVGRGSGDRPYDITPGSPDASILVYRMQHTDPAIAMPELGRSVVHDEGVALVADWIASLPGEC